MLIDALFLMKVKILGVVDTEPKTIQVCGKRLTYFGTDEWLMKNFDPSKVILANGVGSIGNSSKRRAVYERFRNRNYHFMTVIHPNAIVSPDAKLAQGVQVMAGAVIQAGTVLGENSLINTKCSVDHDCMIGSHVHVAPGAILCGGVQIGDASHVGAGAILIQGVTVGKHVFIRAQSLVKSDRKAQ